MSTRNFSQTSTSLQRDAIISSKKDTSTVKPVSLQQRATVVIKKTTTKIVTQQDTRIQVSSSNKKRKTAINTIAAMAGIKPPTESPTTFLKANNKNPLNNPTDLNLTKTVQIRMPLQVAKPASAQKKQVTYTDLVQNTSNQTKPREARQIEHFSRVAPTPGKIFVATESKYAETNPVKGELIVQQRGRPSKHHSFTSEATFDQIYFHLIISDYLDTTSLQTLNKCHVLFAHLCKMLRKIKLDYVYDLFADDKDYATQTFIPLKRRLQYLFLAMLHRMHLPSMIRSLKGNHTAMYRDPKAILDECRPALPPDLLQELSNVLHNLNPARFQGETTAAQREASRAYGNHTSISNNIEKAEQTMNKEERNKFVMALPC